MVLVFSHPIRRNFWLSLAVALVPSAALNAHEAKINFGRDIRPILVDNCFASHGPDVRQRKAKLWQRCFGAGPVKTAENFGNFRA